MCLYHADCWELRAQRLYRSLAECDRVGRRTVLNSREDLAEEGYAVRGFVCRVVGD